jgi:hypothetical protein
MPRGPRLPTREVVPQTVSDEDFVLDDAGDGTLNFAELEGFRFAKFGQKSVRGQGTRALKGATANF